VVDKVRLVLRLGYFTFILLGNLVWKADFSENNFKENLIYLKKAIWIYICIVVLRPTPLAGLNDLAQTTRPRETRCKNKLC